MCEEVLVEKNIKLNLNELEQIQKHLHQLYSEQLIRVEMAENGLLVKSDLLNKFELLELWNMEKTRLKSKH